MTHADKVIEHPHFLNALQKLRTLLLAETPNSDDEGDVVQLVGASRAGKTRMLSVLESDLRARCDMHPKALPPGIVNGSTMPLVRVKTVAPSRGSFSQDKLWSQLIAKLLPLSHIALKRGGLQSEKSMVLNLAEALRNRGTRWLIIDEAHHLLYIRPGRRSAADDADRMYQQMESLKSLVNLSGVKMILSGSPRLLGFPGGANEPSSLGTLDLSEQFAGRSQIIPLFLYNPEDQNDIKSFFEEARLILDQHSLCEDVEFLLKLQMVNGGSVGRLNSQAHSLKHQSKGRRISPKALLESPYALERKTWQQFMASDSFLRTQLARNLDSELEDFLSSNAEFSSKSLPEEAGKAKPVSKQPPRKGKRVGMNYNKRRQVQFSPEAVS